MKVKPTNYDFSVHRHNEENINMNSGRINVLLERVIKITMIIIPISFVGYILYNRYFNSKDYTKARIVCEEEKEKSFNGIVDSFYYDNTRGTVFVKLTNGFSYIIPHSHKYGLKIGSKDSIVKKQGANIYYIFYSYKSLGVDTVDFECDCKNNKCLEKYY